MEAVTDLDPRFEWIEMVTFGQAEPEYVRGACRHLETVPVETIDGEHVANLCLTCDQQFTVVQSANFGG